MAISRREAIKLLAAAATGLAAYATLRNTAELVTEAFAEKRGDEVAPRYANEWELEPMHRRLAMVIDVGACIGCRKCVHACREENNIPDDTAWIEVLEFDKDVPFSAVSEVERTEERVKFENPPRPGKWYLPYQCMQCDNPPCVKVCPTGATYKDEDGIIVVDYTKCIGCRFCMGACPYNARRFNWFDPKFEAGRRLNPQVSVRPKGVVEKCTFCVQRVRRGLKPACVEACPVGARHFGDLSDPNSEVSKILELSQGKVFRLLEEFGTSPQIYYIFKGVKWYPEGGE